MRTAQVLRPKEPRNFKLTAAVCLLLALFQLVAAQVWAWSPSRGVGLVFGFVAAALFLFEMGYPARRRLAHTELPARPALRAKTWVQAHIYLGAVAFVGVLVHAGFGRPTGAMGMLLLLLAAWVTVTGLLGVWLQKYIPAALAEGLRVEALYERIPALVEGLLAEADKLMEGAGDILERFYRLEVRDKLTRVEHSWLFFLDVRGGRERALEPFRRILQFLDAEERERAESLMNIFTEKMELDAHYSLQGILRRWLVLHVPAAGLLLGLIVVHVFTWIWY